jgi:hypothetical protein
MNFRTTFTVAALMTASLAFPVMTKASVIDPVQQLIHFDDASNGDKDYTTADGNFFFDPTNLQSGQCADSTNGGNGSCLIEAPKNGTLTTMVRKTGDKLFSLVSFYFVLDGKGGTDCVSTAKKPCVPSINSLMLKADNGDADTYTVGGTYANLIDYETGLAATTLQKNTAYIATFTSLFNNIKSLTFSGTESAQIRLDCVVAEFNGTTSEPVSSFKKGCGSDGGGVTTPVPLPAGLPLLLSGMALAGVVARRKSRKA